MRRPHPKTRAAQEKPSGLYHTLTRSRNLPQVADFKQFLAVQRLDAAKKRVLYSDNEITARFCGAARRDSCRGVAVGAARADERALDVRERRRRQRGSGARPGAWRLHS